LGSRSTRPLRRRRTEHGLQPRQLDRRRLRRDDQDRDLPRARPRSAGVARAAYDPHSRPASAARGAAMTESKAESLRRPVASAAGGLAAPPAAPLNIVEADLSEHEERLMLKAFRSSRLSGSGEFVGA